MVVGAFWCVVLIGIPFWWKTTEVYRADLPMAEIESWQSSNTRRFVIPTTMHIHLPATLEHTDHHLLDSLQTVLEHRLTELQPSSPCLDFTVSVRTAFWQNQENEDVSQLLERHKEGHIGEYHVYMTTLSSPADTEKHHVIIGNQRTSVIETSVLTKDTVITTVLQVVPNIFFKEFDLLSKTACGEQDVVKNDVDNMRPFKYSSRYQITFSLMNNNPTGTIVDWDIRRAVNNYLYPFLNELSCLYNFTVDSQIQNYASLTMTPKYKQRQDKPSYYYFEPQQLPHFVNSAEWNLASTISSYPTVNFILYIPSTEESPLRIHDAQGNPLLSNAFLIPRWGGIAIKNVPSSAQHGDHYQLALKDLQPIMKVFIAQLRGLMGIQELKAGTDDMNVSFIPARQSGVTILEKDNLIRKRTIENVVNAISTLKSLAQLVNEIPNMVVLDHIDLQVRQSLHALNRVGEALRLGDYAKALRESIEAVELSEKSFFDPTMVSMLYFPDEHKYAIYMPLFVPVSVPLIMALIKQVKKLRGSPKAKTE
ncbi:phosphatidylinositol-glycan biosynthesis class S protein [Radiomyces spectabilis]|uniref:phosphatidylinositol-glycan biosynthesis class S protein n=1 Tax=Radiomyces spectabilis TaxID=64574 RepID=UPI00221F8596|nr:phosphatidylinositol-glycan biosynthesis class S protein [Radiomyces spectabilis]KAI8365323.1 phosphatidylinositol-glycan biosynthesis class S protein [Radiomyces spectabilis]